MDERCWDKKRKSPADEEVRSRALAVQHTSPSPSAAAGSRAVPEARTCVWNPAPSIVAWLQCIKMVFPAGELASSLFHCTCGALTRFAVLLGVATDGMCCGLFFIIAHFHNKSSFSPNLAVFHHTPACPLRLSWYGHTFLSQHQLFFSYPV